MRYLRAWQRDWIRWGEHVLELDTRQFRAGQGIGKALATLVGLTTCGVGAQQGCETPIGYASVRGTGVIGTRFLTST